MCAIPVLIHIEELCAEEERHVIHADAYQHLIAGAVKRLVIVAVDLGNRSH